MPVGKLILFGLLGLVVAEAAVFLTVAWAFGSFIAVFALMATSVFGLAVLARMGRRLASRVADILSQRDFGAAPRSSGFLTTVGGLLLLLPGFITDVVGLLLLLPAVQQRLIDRAPVGRPRPAADRILNLDRSQYRDLPDRKLDNRGDEPPKVSSKRSRRR